MTSPGNLIQSLSLALWLASTPVAADNFDEIRFRGPDSQQAKLRADDDSWRAWPAADLHCMMLADPPTARDTMEIPGIKDFYDGLNHHVAREIEQAADEVDPGAELSHESTHHDNAHDSIDDGLGAAHADAHQDDEHVEHPDHGGLLDALLPAAFHGAAYAVIKFAAEQLTEVALSGTLLGASESAAHAHAEPMHVGSTDGEGFTHQTTGFTCAVVSQQMILNQFHLADPQTGEPLSEARLVYDATSYGWLSDHGTSFSDLGKLLDHYGVANHEGHDWSHLVRDLAAGHQVVMAVNADRLWHDHGPFSEFANLFGNHANHAVVIKGLKVDDHGHVVVVINDPGQADGAGVEYPLDHFQSAIESAHMHYVATDHAPPDWSPAPAIQALAARHDPGTTAIGDESPSFPEALAAMNDRERANFLRDI
jgi:hypothetical protein